MKPPIKNMKIDSASLLGDSAFLPEVTVLAESYLYDPSQDASKLDNEAAVDVKQHELSLI